MGSTFYVRFGKRTLDTLICSAGLLILSPILAAISIAVRFSSSGPIFFRQVRTGQFGRLFRIIKFRTMLVSRAQGSLLTASGDSRITPLGRWLRARKIDELPQLLNVVAGQMSLVGPRPEVPKYTDKYSDQQRRVLSVRPGITSSRIEFDEEAALASAEDKEALYVETLLPEKLAADLHYCDHICFLEDQRIVLATVKEFLRRLIDSRTLRTAPSSVAHGIASRREDRDALARAASDGH
jgi:lipopolysaccharide/colanic/teichoic acid biosynthesis glycosyltransferase